MSTRSETTFSHPLPLRQPGTDKTTPRERQVLMLVALGYINREIGNQLGITEDTVKSYVLRLMRKFCARNRVHLVVTAQLNGMLTIKRSDGVRCDTAAVVISVDGGSAAWADSGGISVTQ